MICTKNIQPFEDKHKYKHIHHTEEGHDLLEISSSDMKGVLSEILSPLGQAPLGFVLISDAYVIRERRLLGHGPSTLLMSDSGREAQCAGRALRVVYGGPDGAVPPVWRPGSYLGRCVGLSPALICISGPSVCGVSAPRPRRSEVTSW